MMKFATVGGVVVTWAYIEFYIDAWVQVLHRAGGAEMIQAGLPASLSREIDFLKREWKLADITPALRDEGFRLIGEIQQLKDFRHDLVHGIADLNDPRVINISMWKIDGQRRRNLKMPYSTEKIAAKVIRMTKLQTDIAAFFSQVANAGIRLKQEGQLNRDN